MRRALGVNELELQLARLTAGHASSYEVKEMGEKMLQKHTEIGHQLARLARQAGVSEKAELSPEQRATAARIASLSGSDFDSAFKATVDAGHVSELAMYREESTRAASPELRALAERRVTALEQSLAKAGPEQKVSRKKEW